MNVVVAASPKGGERTAGITLVMCAHVRRKRGSLESSLDSTRICDPLAIEAGKAVCKSLLAGPELRTGTARLSLNLIATVLAASHGALAKRSRMRMMIGECASV